MRKLILLACTCLLTPLATAQPKDTVRTNIDYRSGRVGNQEEEEPSRGLHNHYFSLQANQLLRQLFNLSNSTTNTGNPFSATYSFNNKTTGGGMAFGLGYATNHVEDKDQGNDRETDNSNINFRFGYDKKVAIAKRWIAGWGMDILFVNAKSFTKATQSGSTVSKVDSKTSGWGLGPRGTLLFNVNSKILLGTEASWYFQKTKNKSDISFFGGSSQKSEQKNSSFSLQVPVAVFLTLKF